MQTIPDGVEAFSSRAEAARLDSPPLLIVDAVTGFLDSRGLGKAPGRAAFLVSDGHGQPNVTYRIQRDRDELL